jgi:hypothetical protein
METWDELGQMMVAVLALLVSIIALRLITGRRGPEEEIRAALRLAGHAELREAESAVLERRVMSVIGPAGSCALARCQAKRSLPAAGSGDGA